MSFPRGGGSAVTFAGDLSGGSSSQTVVGIRGEPVDGATPSAGDALVFDGAKYAPSSVGASVVQRVSATLSSADLLALHATPIELVAAPGAGNAYRVLGLMLTFRWVTTAYASADARLLVGPLAQVTQDYSPWETDPPGAGPGVGLAFMTLGPGESPTGDWAVEIRQTSQTNITPPELVDDQPLAIGNPNSELTDGDGTLEVIVWYSVYELGG